MSRLVEAEFFVHVVQAGSFTGAARELEVTKSHVSKQISRLEERLGSRLLQRSTRQLTLTEPGQAYYERCVEALAAIDDAEDAATQLQHKPRGTLRMTLPAGFGGQYMTEPLAEFKHLYPQLKLDVMFADRYVDILAEGYDVAIRWGVLTDSSLVARKLASAKSVICASPEYLERRGIPEHPDQLVEHECLRYAYSPQPDKWILHGPQGQVQVSVTGGIRANTGRCLVMTACHGCGLAFVPEFHAAPALCDGRLRQVLPEWGDDVDLWAMFPHARHLSTKVRAFVDFFAEQFKDPPWCTWRQPRG